MISFDRTESETEEAFLPTTGNKIKGLARLTKIEASPQTLK